jgi:Fasciclin domain
MILSTSLWLLLLVPCAVFASGERPQIFMESPKYQQLDYPSIADLLTVERSVSIFYSYARETKFSKLLDDPSQNITVLAPTNKAVIALPRKPCVLTTSIDLFVVLTVSLFS